MKRTFAENVREWKATLEAKIGSMIKEHDDSEEAHSELFSEKSKVTFSRTLNTGTKIGTLNIDGDNTDLYCEKDTNTTYSTVTQSANGLMSKTDKIKLDNIEESANNYSHPSYTARTGKPSGNQTPAFGETATVSQITSDSTGHITGATDRTIKIPNTTASSSSNGLMTKGDKIKLDDIEESANNYSHPSYTAQTGKPTSNQTPGFGETTTVSQITTDELGHVTNATDKTIKIPNTTATTSAAGLMSKDDKTKLNGIASSANNYSHPNSGVTAGTNYNSNQTPSFGGTFNIPKLTYNAQGHVTASANSTVTIPSTEATQSEAGLMSKDDKTKLDGISSSANNYTHPSYTARTGKPTANQTPSFGGTATVSQITSDSNGHVTGATDRTITIPNTTATTSAAGLMSSTDKTKLDGVATGANKTTVDSSMSTTSTNPVQNKIVNTAINTKTVTVEKQATAESGYIATYIVKQNGTQVGEKINIPKDFLVKSASMKTCSTANSPLSGLAVGDPYLDFIINSKDGSATDEHIYINVKDLVDTYTAGTGLTLSNGQFSLTDASNYVKKSSTSGYIKNDGSIGTPPNTTYSAATQSAAGLMSATDKTKLDGIITGANNYTHPSYTSFTGNPDGNKTPAFGSTFTVTQIGVDSQGHVSSKTDRTVKIPNALGDGTTAGLSTNDYTTTEKTKLAGIATNANNYSHPSTHAASMITDATAHSNIGSAENDTQATINTKIDTALSGKQAAGNYAASNHTHDYSSTYAPKTHTHASSDVTGLTASLNVVTDANGKLSTEAKNNHTHSYVPTGNVKNDLTTGGASNVLSAEQGKTLNTNKLAKNADDTSTGYITAKGFKVTGAASGTFVKADGSTAAANNYSHPSGQQCTHNHNTAYLSKTANDETSGKITAAGFIVKNATSGYFVKADGTTAAANNYSHPSGQQCTHNHDSAYAPKSHTNTGDTATYGKATASAWGHAKAGGSVGAADTAAGNAGTDNGLYARADHVHKQSDIYAPKSHAVNANTYGQASASVFGHAKAFNGTTTAIGTSANNGTDNGLYARGDHTHNITKATITGLGISASDHKHASGWKWYGNDGGQTSLASGGNTDILTPAMYNEDLRLVRLIVEGTAGSANGGSKGGGTIPSAYRPSKRVSAIGRAEANIFVIVETDGSVKVKNNSSQAGASFNCEMLYYY